jgi:hypothetical protein
MSALGEGTFSLLRSWPLPGPAGSWDKLGASSGRRSSSPICLSLPVASLWAPYPVNQTPAEKKGQETAKVSSAGAMLPGDQSQCSSTEHTLLQRETKRTIWGLSPQQLSPTLVGLTDSPIPNFCLLHGLTFLFFLTPSWSFLSCRQGVGGGAAPVRMHRSGGGCSPPYPAVLPDRSGSSTSSS